MRWSHLFLLFSTTLAIACFEKPSDDDDDDDDTEDAGGGSGDVGSGGDGSGGDGSGGDGSGGDGSGGTSQADECYATGYIDGYDGFSPDANGWGCGGDFRDDYCQGYCDGEYDAYGEYYECADC